MLVLWWQFAPHCSKCRARNSECKTRQKACGFRRNQIVAAIVNNNNEFCTVLADAPHCLEYSTDPVPINNYPASALIDLSRSSSFINYELAHRLKLKIKPSTRYIILAMCSKQALIKGVYHVKITLNNKDYKNARLEIFEDLYGDVLLGLDFQKQHAAVTSLHGRSKSILRIKEAEIEVCSLTAFKLMVLRLFVKFKPHARPTA